MYRVALPFTLAAVVLLAMLELRQDWNLSDAELARRSAR